ncbi:MAG TPA: cytochrome c-type biogenesis protein CcmH [Terracidiphilus sp.]|nr:cytochrome c-type biogenesis protein CcmH [Terracidiphilus sp.]
MLPTLRFNFWTKSALALFLAAVVSITLAATNSTQRFNNLSHRLMCTCGCNQLLGECNHVGCTSSTQENAELRADIASGLSDKEILAGFSQKYGVTVLAAPPTHGFNLVAWVAPFAVFAAALLGTILLVRQWSVGKSQLAQQPADPHMDALREKIRRETGSGNDGGI